MLTTSAIAPDLVHSLHAAALQFPICEAKDRGITDMMAIHDYIGGLAPDMDIIADAVRIGFVKCHDAMPLESFREAVLAVLPDGADLDPLPERGDFDVRRVLGSSGRAPRTEIRQQQRHTSKAPSDHPE